MSATMDDLFGDVIYSYTRRQAIEDGVLVQLSGDGYEGDPWVPAMVREAGFKWPVAMTTAAFTLTVAEIVDDDGNYEMSPAAERACNDMKGRLWDVLWMLRHAIRTAPRGGRELLFQLRCVTTSVRPSLVTLKCVTGPDDTGEPCMTIMLPEED